MACPKCTSTCTCRLRERDTNTVDLSLAGSGSQRAPWRLSGQVLISGRPDPIMGDCGAGNFLVERVNATDGGLCVPLSADDDNVTQFGTDGGIYTPSQELCLGEGETCLEIDADGCLSLRIADSIDGVGGPCDNALTCTNDGLFVPKVEVFSDFLDIPQITDQMHDIDDFFNGQPNRFHHQTLPGGTGDVFDNSALPLTTVMNPSNCCPMELRFDGNFDNSPAYTYNGDLCAVAAAFRAAGPLNSINLIASSAFDLFVNNVPLATILGGRNFRFTVRDPAAGMQGCGVQFSFNDADNFVPGAIIPPGGEVNLAYRMRSLMIVNGGGFTLGNAAHEAQARVLVEELFKGISPYPADNGNVAPFVLNSTGVSIFGVSECG